MQWSKQCNSAAAKAMSVLGMIKRTFNTLNKDMFLTLYSTYIRPHLEYCSQVWAPYFKNDIDVLEKVQRRATKLVWCIKKLSYEQRLEYLGLYSLSRRRQRGDLIETYQILRNTEDIDNRNFFIRADTVQLRGHNYKLYKNRSLKQCRICFFNQRVVNCWNLLPQEVVDAPYFQEDWTNSWTATSWAIKADCLLIPWNMMMMMMTMMRRIAFRNAPCVETDHYEHLQSSETI